MQRTVIFGATSAIAQEVARQLVVRGGALYCIGRNSAKLDALLADLRVRAGSGQVIGGEEADLNDLTRHESLLLSAEKALGGLDALLVAQGSLSDQKSCEVSPDLTVREFNTNALSAISILTLAANKMEAQKAGVLAAISSVAGDRGRQSNYVYGAAKGALTIFMEGLRNRLTKVGVSVVTIKPGFVDTPMTASFDKNGVLWSNPEIIARGIVIAMEKGSGEVYLPGFWRFIMLVIRHIPSRMFNKMSL
ncbi:SDR family oxidoreductase [Methylococcaceae bacterium WWC4]|nr:SDR family oxidoreductase [Methylococcaceae bacterium WWC4]OHX35345.1 short-chain dehydrogenase [Methylomonas sp. LWB]